MFNFTSRFGVVQQMKMLLQWNIWQINKPIHVPLTFPNYAGKHLVVFSFTVFQIAFKAINIIWIMPTTRLVDAERRVSECWWMSRWLGSPRSVVRPTPLVRTERLGLLRRLQLPISTFEACSRNFSNSWDNKPNCSLWLRHFSSRSRTFDYREEE